MLRQPDPFFGAEYSIAERNVKPVFQIGTALTTGTLSAATATPAEHLAEYIGSVHSAAAAEHLAENVIGIAETAALRRVAECLRSLGKAC